MIMDVGIPAMPTLSMRPKSTFQALRPWEIKKQSQGAIDPLQLKAWSAMHSSFLVVLLRHTQSDRSKKLAQHEVA